jgi:hypothetical protein
MNTTFIILTALISVNGLVFLFYNNALPTQNSKIKSIQLELHLFLFKIRKIKEFVKIYCKWQSFVSKKVRSDYYNAG